MVYCSRFVHSDTQTRGTPSCPPRRLFTRGKTSPSLTRGTVFLGRKMIFQKTLEFSEMVHFLNPISRAENYIYTIPRADIWKIKIVKNLQKTLPARKDHEMYMYRWPNVITISCLIFCGAYTIKMISRIRYNHSEGRNYIQMSDSVRIQYKLL